MVICHYSPGGNVRGVRMYEEGEPCSDCPGDKRCPRGRWLETGEDDITKHLLVKDLDIDYFDIDRIILILCRL